MRRRHVLAGLTGVASAAAAPLAGCLGLGDGGDGGGGTRPTPDGGGGGGAGPDLASPAFPPGTAVPPRYTCDGEDVSPPLTVKGVPDGVESLALVVDDPDAPGGTFVHWLLWNVPPDTTDLPEGVPTTETVAALDGVAQGTNSFGNVGYGGPCPPAGERHRYRFDLFALDATLDVEPGEEVGALGDAMEGHVVGSVRLTGEYERA